MEQINFNDYTIEKVKDLETITAEQISTALSGCRDFLDDNLAEIYADYYDNITYKRELLKVHKKPVNIPLLDIMTYLYDNCPVEGVLWDYVRVLARAKEETIKETLSNIKGVSDNQTSLNKVIKFVNSFRSIYQDSAIDKVINRLNLKFGNGDIYYLYSNDLFDILTASYSANIRSCYNIDCGDYNNSLSYIINDNISGACNWYVLKEVKADSLEKLNDTTALYSGTLNRRFVTTNQDNSVQLMGSLYGIDKRISAQDLKFLMWAYNGHDINDTIIDSDCFTYAYHRTDYVKAYLDYFANESNSLRVENNSPLEMWNDLDAVAVSRKGAPLVCDCCGDTIQDPDDAIYINGEVYCHSCCYWCDSCEEYFLTGEGVEVNGCYYCDHCINRV